MNTYTTRSVDSRVNEPNGGDFFLMIGAERGWTVKAIKAGDWPNVKTKAKWPKADGRASILSGKATPSSHLSALPSSGRQKHASTRMGVSTWASEVPNRVHEPRRATVRLRQTADQ